MAATASTGFVGCQGEIQGDAVFASVYNSSSNGEDGAKVGVATTGETNDFTTNTIFLCRELQCDEGGRVELIDGCSGRIKSAVANEKLYVAESKRCGVG